MIRQQIFFHGNVQGVGFRFTVRRISQGRAVTGFVRNLSNGSVEVMVEGEPAELRAFVAEIQAQMHGHVRGVDVHTDQALGVFAGFEIR